MNGTVEKTERATVTIHTYTSPESGLAANTHIIELATQVLVLDTQYGVPFAIEAAELAHSLGKPVTRVYVSHDHPDHFFGAGFFRAPVYALAETQASIAAAGDAMLAGNKVVAGDFVPDSVVVPGEIVAPGVEVIDGVRFEFTAVRDAEADVMLTIALPEEGIVMAQDLVYDNLHLFIAGGHLDGWANAVRALREKDYTTVLPGHGAPGGAELYDFVLDYLAGAAHALAAAADADELKSSLVAAFPDAGGVGLLDIQNGYLFPQQ
ncbi:MBL fold metallo-hydrolase [Microbacterium aoyamense]|uniref:MBL fold metallo-hydrolase n=1 Tax=Microbacterium aoyamense TaxID=344166 RepID=A0ABN2PCZ0_9MICO|nr:MBL fold metallo-hydrolase [Microbacterium aoyamense]